MRGAWPSPERRSSATRSSSARQLVAEDVEQQLEGAAEATGVGLAGDHERVVGQLGEELPHEAGLAHAGLAADRARSRVSPARRACGAARAGSPRPTITGLRPVRPKSMEGAYRPARSGIGSRVPGAVGCGVRPARGGGPGGRPVPGCSERTVGAAVRTTALTVRRRSLRTRRPAAASCGGRSPGSQPCCWVIIGPPRQSARPPGRAVRTSCASEPPAAHRTTDVSFGPATYVGHPSQT